MATEKCKYCHDGDDYREKYGEVLIPIGDEDICIDLYTDNKVPVSIWIGDHQLASTGLYGYNVDIKMNYCPVCGRKLDS